MTEHITEAECAACGDCCKEHYEERYRKLAAEVERMRGALEGLIKLVDVIAWSNDINISENQDYKRAKAALEGRRDG